ncbi:hypothetical protein MMA231_00078 [Asticcacaulis sp. MM231]|uniref:hypothetical protein n=1 Tax=Asticcacaulis sp. MM231 TaxID=3157666 RepID=UPI0032D599E0
MTADTRHTDLRQLRYVEHFIVWLFRTSVSCSPGCRMIHREFKHAFGTRVEEAAIIFEQVLLSLSKGGRAITMGRPGHIELTHDEQSLLALFAAAQAQDEVRFRAHACWLMGHGRVKGLYDHASALGSILRERGLEFRTVIRETDIVARAMPISSDRVRALPS